MMSPASILVVEDIAPTRELMVLALRSAGYHVVAARDGEEAMNLLRDGAFDLIITDVVMPERDGIELLMHLRKSGTRTRVIAISGAPDLAELYLHTAEQLGATRVLLKPIRSDELFGTVRATLAEPIASA